MLQAAEIMVEVDLVDAKVVVIEPDEASRAATNTNPLDPATRGPAAAAGRAQGRGLTTDWT
jgi:NTE family protein